MKTNNENVIFDRMTVLVNDTVYTDFSFSMDALGNLLEIRRNTEKGSMPVENIDRSSLFKSMVLNYNKRENNKLFMVVSDVNNINIT
jgi:hypothetical protein